MQNKDTQHTTYSRTADIPAQASPDDALRQQALCTKHSFIVQAPAGSGKTELLIQRVLALLAQVEEPEHVLAITFSKKAAAEMRQRVLNALQEGVPQSHSKDAAAKPSTQEQGRQQLALAAYTRNQEKNWQLLEMPHRLRIQTIDSLCSHIVRSAPFQRKTSGSNTVLDDSELLYQRAAMQALSALEKEGPLSQAAGSFLDYMDNQYMQAASMLAHMLRTRDQWLGMLSPHASNTKNTPNAQPWREWLQQHNQAWAYWLQQSLGTLEQTLEQTHLGQAFAQQAQRAVRILTEQGNEPSLLTALAKVDNWPQTPKDSDFQTPTQFYQGLQQCLGLWRSWAAFLLTQAGRVRKNLDKNLGYLNKQMGGGAGEQAKREMKLLLKQLAAVPHAVAGLSDVRHYCAPPFAKVQGQELQAIMRMAWHANQCLQALFAQEGGIDYLQITQDALLVLDEAPFLHAFGKTGLHHLLVDEFQDTSHTQLQLLTLLTRHFNDGQENSLFLVGDPMQAIYRFRGAEVAVFLHVIDHGLGQVKPQFLRLQVNFRSSPALIRWTNRIFEQMSPAKQYAALGAIRFAQAMPPQTSIPPRNHPHTPCIAYVCTPNREATPSHAPPDWAQQLAMRLQSCMQQDTTLHQQTPRVAVLFRTRKHVQPFLQAMRLHRIAYQGVDLETLGTQQEALDISSLVHALYLPDDAIAWMAVLRAPWCGLCLSDLHQICPSVHNGHDTTLLSVYERLQNPAVQATLSLDGRARIQPVLHAFKAAFVLRERLALRDWVEGCWLALNGPATLQNPNITIQTQALHTVQACFAQLEKPLQGGELPWPYALEARLAKVYAPNQPSSLQQVQVMSIHKAKGTEFDVVVLPGLHFGVKNSDTSVLRWEKGALNTSMDDTPGDSLAHKQPTPNLLAQAVFMAPRPNAYDAAAQKEPSLYEWLAQRDKQRQANEALRLLYVAVTRAKKHILLGGELKVAAPQGPGKNLPEQGSFLRFLWDGGEEKAIKNSVPDSLSATHEAKTQPPFAAQTTDQPAEATPRMLQRLNLGWQCVDYPPGLPDPPWDDRWTQTQGAKEEASVKEALGFHDFDHARHTNRLVGEEVHALLMQMANDGLQGWNSTKIAALQAQIKARLLAQGVDLGHLTQAVQTVQHALNNVITDANGRWLLRCPGVTEMPLWVANGSNQPKKRILDRSFVHQKIRWIVDYKVEGQTHELRGVQLEAFIAERIDEHKAQLQAYGDAFYRWDARLPICLGVYFALQRHFVSWKYQPVGLADAL